MFRRFEIVCLVMWKHMNSDIMRGDNGRYSIIEYMNEWQGLIQYHVWNSMHKWEGDGITYILTGCNFVCLCRIRFSRIAVGSLLELQGLLCIGWCINHHFDISIIVIRVCIVVAIGCFFGICIVFICLCINGAIDCLFSISIVFICLCVDGAISSVGAWCLGVVGIVVTASTSRGWVGAIAAPLGLLALLVAAWCCKTLLPPFLRLVGVLITMLLSFFLCFVGVLAMVNVIVSSLCCCVVVVVVVVCVGLVLCCCCWLLKNDWSRMLSGGILCGMSVM